MGKQIIQDKRYTYSEFLEMESEEGERWELIDGKPVLLARPSQRHQDILLNIASALKNHLKGKTCKVRMDSDVNLFGKEDDEIRYIVAPDLYVSCDLRKDDGQKHNGAPDLVIEILSTNYMKDRWRNYQLYEQAGVREFWVVDQYRNTVDIFVLKDGEFKLQGVYGREDEDTAIIPSSALEDFEIHVNDIFE
ncbi:Uma2 family endonuclease [Thermoactinomyces sp. DSM 45892]|uniref:Uma2 family endonuclease n=1 Tax=Thermoactinomyces sp. DSM 45892 TaxID=1882753 RepID=UPI0008990E79|nr:Uma2 family endonuclease [Thermoactinomyces sp. DSM 45892]SDX92881.1 Endonuclease, Uma2 family (restriction endonuclease fold) [Thermoactinomyces sp. DSM 45892]